MDYDIVFRTPDDKVKGETLKWKFSIRGVQNAREAWNELFEELTIQPERFKFVSIDPILPERMNVVKVRTEEERKQVAERALKAKETWGKKRESDETPLE